MRHFKNADKKNIDGNTACDTAHIIFLDNFIHIAEKRLHTDIV